LEKKGEILRVFLEVVSVVLPRSHVRGTKKKLKMLEECGQLT